MATKSIKLPKDAAALYFNPATAQMELVFKKPGNPDDPLSSSIIAAHAVWYFIMKSGTTVKEITEKFVEEQIKPLQEAVRPEDQVDLTLDNPIEDGEILHEVSKH